MLIVRVFPERVTMVVADWLPFVSFVHVFALTVRIVGATIVEKFDGELPIDPDARSC